MMVIRHLEVAPAHPLDTVGARQDVLIWDYGVITGHVAAVHVLEEGGADLVVEFEVPQPVVVPADLCERMAACRLDRICPFWSSCEEHVRTCEGGDACDGG